MIALGWRENLLQAVFARSIALSGAGRAGISFTGPTICVAYRVARTRRGAERPPVDRPSSLVYLLSLIGWIDHLQRYASGRIEILSRKESSRNAGGLRDAS